MEQAMREPVSPEYCEFCERAGCEDKATHTIVLHFWPRTLFRLLRNQTNSVKLFPAVTTCEAHSHSLSEIGQRFIDTSIEQIKDHFTNLDKAPPDLADILISCVPIDEAIEAWKEPAQVH